MKRTIARALKFIKETKDYAFNSMGELVFEKRNVQISFDKTAHKGGFWKVFNKITGKRYTMNIDLTKIIGK